MLGATPQNVFRSIAGNVNIQNRCLSLGPSSNQKLKVTSRGFVLVGCYCFADFNCVLLQHALQCKWCTNCPEGACIGTAVSCTSEHDCRINQREIFLSSNCTETSCEASDCSKCTASGKCMWTRQFKRTGTDGGGVVEIGTVFICYGYNNVFGKLHSILFPGETRRILSVNPTYDWTCFSYALLNVSPMQVESSPPLPCPPPCHTLHNCSLCLGSRGSDGGWQHCVWSMALQQV